MKKTVLMGATAIMALGTSAAVADSVTAVTDLNLRMGPGPAYQIAGVIAGGASAELSGCVQGGEWCEVTYNGQTGWASGGYLQHNDMVVAEDPQVSIIQYEETQEAPGAAMIGTATGATVGALVGGPIGALVGGVIGGGVSGEAAEVTEETTVYIQENPVEPVFLDGEVVVGAAVPDTVQYYEIPSSQQYSYMNVNGNTVLIDPETNTIVRVIR
ncbi:DUF1236 domain-containing protein [Maritimibacter sp. DP1N21-5]|uniref:DUF1236 domain-containing protein n=1 Tax=Maritimibacter sp. DP1N21-5 TaxID=2836867 RepID=UPI001C446DBC|nr:DUF1236 domain-containing protein [Maritimibacter sp. DP1N21-5]MBV7409079.1 DUF1236 domain-containing protein [Maritimibacter sp. DP1N21-5]